MVTEAGSVGSAWFMSTGGARSSDPRSSRKAS